ncbi:type III PLP-dependent enzyme [Paenibacillus pinisoli]|uniref:Type III PLP-dependent enzyme n=2 Tax=Paenibacillus pinisoli TaxID=1276110 RepID=A0A3A6PPD3_9BACL|nr:type III PLP-dependent enzyme [Paenibacillus pinisoli]
MGNYEWLFSNLHDSVNIYLSLKTNNNIYLANLFQQAGSGVEVASSGELTLALKAGFSPDRIIMSGPGKTVNDLTTAVDIGIRSINVESIDELHIISQIATKKEKIVPVSVRINPDFKAKKPTISMGGNPRQFGVDESQLNVFFESLTSLHNLKFLGIHIYLGTQILLSETIVESMKYTIELASLIKETYGFTSTLINLGGGFGVPYFPHEQPLDIKKLLEEINALIIDYTKINEDTKFIIESGRFLLADYGIYVATILYKKISKGQTFLVTDGGMHHHVSSTFRGRTMRNNFPLKLISSSKRHEAALSERVNITGVLCTPEDCMALGVDLPAAEPGDRIVWFKSGAYGLAYSPQQFLGHATPWELLLNENEIIVIRQRGTECDLFLNQVMDFQELKSEVPDGKRSKNEVMGIG